MKKSSLVFLILFCLMTFAPVPVFYLFRDQIGYDNTENKAESEFPALTPQNYTTWPRRFEEWLSDTLPFKTQFIRLCRGMQMRSGADYAQSDVIRGKGNWLFYRKTIENYKGLTRFTDEELQIAQESLERFFDPLTEKGIQCLLFIAPDKEQVYSSFMPESIRRVTEESRGDQLTAYLRENVTFPVLYPRQELTELGQALPIYFETDTHWTDLGGYYAARMIGAAMTGEPMPETVPDYRSIPETGMDLANMLGLSEQFTEGNAVLIDHNDGITVRKTQTIDHGTIQRFVSDVPNGKKLLIVGDSFSEYFLRSAIHDVSEVLFVTYGELYRLDPEEEAPDYVVVMLVERNLPFLLNGIY